MYDLKPIMRVQIKKNLVAYTSGKGKDLSRNVNYSVIILWDSSLRRSIKIKYISAFLGIKILNVIACTYTHMYVILCICVRLFSVYRDTS